MLRSALHAGRAGHRRVLGRLRSITSETSKLPNRRSVIAALRAGEEFDLLIIGAGATGSGAALDAAQRGLKVACIEREDFASGTSSRSTKLLWGGSRYLVQAFVTLLSSSLIKNPYATVRRFVEDFNMVMNCHRERVFMLKQQPHLTKWLPIAVPLDRWFLWPPPFGFPLAALGPIGLFPLFFKFYDALSGFSCPPSHIMWPSRARRKFPQLSNNDIKYCPVFYEGTHDDARTNLAVAQTAALEGAAVANYCEATALLSSTLGGRVEGATVRDAVSGETFNIRAKSVLLCGGPFTDTLRVMEDPDCKSAVNGASGIHIVLPAYFAPSNIGLVDMSTSDGRFMFFLPWKGHVVVGTTDSPATPTMRPIPAEAEIKWLLHEASKYLSPELKLRRQDVLSAWSGIRPLALDPHASSTAAASRDHVISYNPASGTVFVSGGKWTTFREMAEDAVDKVLATNPLLGAKTPKCRTLQTHFIGFKGYSENLTIRLIQQYDMSARVAEHLASVYGGRAEDVVKIAKELNEQKIANGTNGAGSGSGGALIDVEEDYDESFAGAEALLVPGYPFIEAEVVFAARYDWAVRAEDVLARRTRLAFLNKDAAVRAIPKVVRLMAGELGWSLEQQKAEMRRCAEYLRHFGGSKPLQADTSVRLATHADLLDVFRKAKPSQASGLTRDTLRLAAEMLNHPLSDEEVSDCLLSGGGTGVSGDAAHVPFDAFALWWNSERLNPGLTELIASKMATPQIKGTGVLFG